MKKEIVQFINEIIGNQILSAVALAIVFDTIMGILRAIKERKFNSCVGIDGAIRKVGMVLSVVLLRIADAIVKINLIGFVPQNIWSSIGKDIPLHMGLAEFFGLLFVAYEIVSILKNMTLTGLPVKGLWVKVKLVLSKYTQELPDED